MATAQDLFGDYNYYRAHTQHVHELADSGQWVCFLKETPERLAALARMAAWCAERKYDSRHWLCWLFYRGHWRYARPFNQLVPSKRSHKKLVAAYAESVDLPLFHRRMRQIVYVEQVTTGQIYDSNRDLSATTEALKKRYLRLSDPEGCMTDDQSCGYHPQSLACARCALAQECERRLRESVSFDITALRDGRITVEQARMEVACRGR